MTDQRLDTAQRFGEREYPNTTEEVGGALPRAELDAHHAPESSHLTPGQFVLRVAGQPRVIDVLRAHLLDEPVGDAPTIRIMLSHGKMQRFGPAQREPDRKSTRLNSSHIPLSRMPSS